MESARGCADIVFGQPQAGCLRAVAYQASLMLPRHVIRVGRNLGNNSVNNIRGLNLNTVLFVDGE